MKCYLSTTLILLGSIGWGSICQAKQQTLSGQVNTSEKMVEQWLSTERQASVLQSNWLSKKPILEQRLLLLEAQKVQLQTLLNNKSTDTSQVEQKRTGLIEEQSKLEISQHELEQSLTSLTQQLSRLQPLLAPPIQQAWQQERAQISSAPDASSQLQNNLAQLNKLAEFNQRISVIQAPIINELGESILVKQLYLGASTAWFVSLDGSYVGTGQVTDNGWKWSFKDSSYSTNISQAIAIFEKKSEADFVDLPLQLTKRGAE